MQVAKDVNGNEVFASTYTGDGNNLTCQFCGSLITFRHGGVRQAHFAHRDRSKSEIKECELRSTLYMERLPKDHPAKRAKEPVKNEEPPKPTDTAPVTEEKNDNIHEPLPGYECPNCHQTLILHSSRTARYSPFLTCPNPQCKNVRINLYCSWCGAKVRKVVYGSIFYSCSRYPACKFKPKMFKS